MVDLETALCGFVDETNSWKMLPLIGRVLCRYSRRVKTAHTLWSETYAGMHISLSCVPGLVCLIILSIEIVRVEPAMWMLSTCMACMDWPLLPDKRANNMAVLRDSCRRRRLW